MGKYMVRYKGAKVKGMGKHMPPMMDDEEDMEEEAPKPKAKDNASKPEKKVVGEILGIQDKKPAKGKKEVGEKGNAKSGNHGHRGIPGHRGGSAPKGGAVTGTGAASTPPAAKTDADAQQERDLQWLRDSNNALMNGMPKNVQHVDADWDSETLTVELQGPYRNIDSYRKLYSKVETQAQKAGFAIVDSDGDGSTAFFKLEKTIDRTTLPAAKTPTKPAAQQAAPAPKSTIQWPSEQRDDAMKKGNAGAKKRRRSSGFGPWQ